MIDLHLSTIGEGAAALAREYGLGIEIAEFSYAANMDTDFARWDRLTRDNLLGIEKRVFHAPYNELCPAAVDPLISEITRRRLDQAYTLMQDYNIIRMVVHSGYVPYIYVKSWFIDRSAEFWRGFLYDKPPDFALLLENALEESPDILRDIVEKTGDTRFRLCLDVGHAEGTFSKTPVMEWVETTAPLLGHVHVHNHYHNGDIHNPPGDGLIDMRTAISEIIKLQPHATYTAETADLQSAVSWFENNGFL